MPLELVCKPSKVSASKPLPEPSLPECQIVLALHVIVLLPPCIRKTSKELPVQALISVVTALLPALLLGFAG